jgi:predicted nucleic acid-binding protein
VTAAVARRRKEKTVTSRQASAILSRFRKHLTGRYLILEITPALADDAMTLADKYTLRAYDAVQLAGAIIANKDWTDAGLGSFVFASADRKLNAAATAEGLTVENPENHP